MLWRTGFAPLRAGNSSIVVRAGAKPGRQLDGLVSVSTRRK
jgi:hypothetical protein